MDDRPVVFRVQDADGRGPFRPGFSRQWLDEDAPVGRLSESIFDLVPLSTLRAIDKSSSYFGCACRSFDGLMEWFTPIERERLKSFGFHPVRLRVDGVLAESPWQLVFIRQRALASGAVRLRWTPKLVEARS